MVARKGSEYAWQRVYEAEVHKNAVLREPVLTCDCDL